MKVYKDEGARFIPIIVRCDTLREFQVLLEAVQQEEQRRGSLTTGNAEYCIISDLLKNLESL